MSQPFPKADTRQALSESLPENDQASSSPSAGVAFTYVPPSHARALDPENTLVEGIRGAGKSFWWAALNSEPHRRFVSSVFPETRLGSNVEVSQGFGPQLPTKLTPSKDTLVQLAESFEPRHIWRAVVAVHARFPAPFPGEAKWREKVQWVRENPEDYDGLFYAADEALASSGKVRLILFDALDRLADDWPHIRPLARALLQVALDLRACRGIRAKLFVRPDMLEDREICAFPDASKLLGRKVALTWQRVDLYTLLFQCLGNAPKSGSVFRGHCDKVFHLKWEQEKESKAWVVPRTLRTDEDKQKEMFHAIAGPTMASGPSGHKRGFPYTWLPNHLLDGRDQVSPRSFCAALRHAANSETPEEWSYPLHYKAIQAGVQAASRIRVDEITVEDYPWVGILMAPLRGQVTVPCSAEEILTLWEKKETLSTLRDVLAEQGDQKVKLPPQHMNEGPEGILQDLAELGLIQRLLDKRIQMPDVYRIAFGLGRRGGVKPLK
ncbi:MAG: hypothetical protein HY267_00125 [Deltaproteobacteria bacterium]|nr:hypothetical protein [Deltaproteobacteria bacterium]